MIAALAYAACCLFWAAIVVSTIVAATVLLITLFERAGLTVADDYTDADWDDGFAALTHNGRPQ